MSVHRAVVRAARELLREWDADAPGNCVFAAAATVEAARRRGLALRLAAGTCFWPRDIDGGPAALWGYAWEGADSPAVKAALARGVLPEMHVWAVEGATDDIVDVVTGDFPARCKALRGLDWRAPRPPDWWWGPPEALPVGVHYESAPDATAVAATLLKERGYRA